MLLFVYGPYVSPKYLSEKSIDFISSCKAILNGYKSYLSTRTDDWGQAMIDIEEKNYSSVEGVLYELTDEAAMLMLHDFEKTVAKEYERILVDINVGKGPNVDAYTYISTKKVG
jgi:hypothetical protein